MGWFNPAYLHLPIKRELYIRFAISITVEDWSNTLVDEGSCLTYPVTTAAGYSEGVIFQACEGSRQWAAIRAGRGAHPAAPAVCLAERSGERAVRKVEGVRSYPKYLPPGELLSELS